MSRYSGRLFWMATGVVAGVTLAALFLFPDRKALASNDRVEDYVMCTGWVADRARSITDGVWLLDYRSGKLLGTVIDRFQGRIMGWAEVDLVSEFGIPPRQNVHFLMVTGNIAQGQSALYVAETNSGKFGVYTLGPRDDGQSGFSIRRHDLVTFRPQSKPNN
jgi:hypothetical protein